MHFIALMMSLGYLVAFLSMAIAIYSLIFRSDQNVVMVQVTKARACRFSSLVTLSIVCILFLIALMASSNLGYGMPGSLEDWAAMSIPLVTSITCYLVVLLNINKLTNAAKLKGIL